MLPGGYFYITSTRIFLKIKSYNFFFDLTLHMLQLLFAILSSKSISDYKKIHNSLV